MLQTNIVTLLLRLSVFWYVCYSLLPAAESKNNRTPVIIINGLREQMMQDIKSGYWSESVELMKRHLNQDTLAYEQLINITEYDDYPLEAAENGYIELIEIMLDNGLPINNRFGYGEYTMLLAATFSEQYKQVKFLVQRGADVNVRDMFSTTPLHWAAINCDVNIVQLLVESGADVNVVIEYGNTPLYFAASRGCELVVQYLVDKGCNTTITNISGETAADVASLNSIKEILQNSVHYVQNTKI